MTATGPQKLALGTVQFGLAYGVANITGQVPRDTAGAMVAMAADAGVDTIDTAIGYGDSEARLGGIGVEGFRVVTKLRALPADVADVGAWVEGQVRASLDRLGIPRLHGVLLHRPADLLGPHGEALYRALAGLREAALAAKTGVSVYAPAELDALARQYSFDLVQGPFNLVDRRLETSGWLARLKDDGVEIHTRSAFLQGVLLMARDEVPAKFGAWAHLWDAWHGWLAASGETAVRACLACPLSRPEIDRVVVGADGVGQFGEILAAAAAGPLPGLPDLSCEDEALINPSNWTSL